MLYKMPHFRSSKIFGTWVVWRLRNHTFDGHISGLEQDRDNLKPLLPTKSPMPYRLVPLPSRSRDHTTSGLAFLAFRGHKNRRKKGHGAFPVRGTCQKLGLWGPRTGGHGVTTLQGAYTSFQSHMPQCRVLPPGDFNYIASRITGYVSHTFTKVSGPVAGEKPSPWPEAFRHLTKGNWGGRGGGSWNFDPRPRQIWK